ncbi:SRPBCC family protein [Nannocystis punicea]|uniref:SRPBCC domain-containing protein n=1 Tax=Nannocystis punicea TaxID=2995304 RepID=A0ABY7H5E8_9BACT|nr:SRPBCC domain-containing protein [Nannocystis poenicansa]WAS94194.1 SRPBCC domain-containing protein [Nannocystis poenicansa]
MPVKNDAEKRWVELEFVVPGTPEQLWRAMATGPGIGAWFTTTTVDERVGGAIEFDFGGGAVSKGVVTRWEPPFRFCYEERGWNGEAPPVATEITIRTRAGEQCVVRMVHSLFTSEDSWDDELEGFESGWPGFFEVLRVYMRQFAGQKASSLRVTSSHAGTPAEAWKSLSAGLGLAGADVGEQREAPSEAPSLAGTVERVQQGGEVFEQMLRLERPGPGVAAIGTYRHAGSARVGVSIYLYGEQAEATAAEAQRRWSAWMAERFPAREAEAKA